MSKVLKLGGIFLVLWGFSACKPAEGGKNGKSAALPERVGSSGDAAAAVRVGVLGQGGGTRLLIDLGRPPQANETVGLWACFGLPDDSFALGRAVCKDDAQKSVEVTAANVDFTCLTNPDFTAIKAKRPLSTDFCSSYEVFAYQFKPTFNIRVEN